MKLEFEEAKRWIVATENHRELNNRLSAFTEIDESTAKLLGESHGWIPLDLNGLSSLSAASAKELGKYGNYLSLDGLTTLSSEIAHHLNSAYALSLRAVSSIEAKAAAELARCKNWLILGLRSPSDEVMSELCATNATLELPCLETLSDAGLEHVVRRRQACLRLSLTKISPSQAKILELFQGEHLELNALVRLEDEDVARSLSRLKCRISMDGVEQFSDSIALMLSNSCCEKLRLSGRLRLSEQGYVNLCSGGQLSSWLGLTGDIELPEYAYEVLNSDDIINARMATQLHEMHPSNRNHSSDLKGRVLTRKAAAILATVKGIKNLTLRNLESLPEEVAVELSTRIGNLDVGCERLSASSARYLAQRKFRKGSDWSLTFSRMSVLPVAVAAELAKSLYNISFYKLSDLSDNAAAELFQHRGSLYMAPGLTRLSAAVAKLAQRPRTLISLDYITEVAEDASEVLRGSICPCGGFAEEVFDDCCRPKIESRAAGKKKGT